MNTLYLLVGIPGSGKSTWVNNHIWTKDCAYISTDYYVEKFAQKLNKTYTEVFDNVIPRAVRLMNRSVHRARAFNRDIVWDQTSVTIKTRSKKLRMLCNYRAIAVVFATPPLEELYNRLNQRDGKHIPQRVIHQMLDHWQEPSLEEGFSEIWHINF